MILHINATPRPAKALHVPAILGFLLLWCVLFGPPGLGQVGASEGLDQAMQSFGKERDLAEDYVTMMGTIRDANPQQFTVAYAHGIKHYAQARKEFNALIVGLQGGLTQREAIKHSKGFDAALTTAVQHRKAFTEHVDQMLEAFAKEGEKTKFGVTDYISAATDLGKLLLDAGETIWQEYQKLQETKRQETMDQLKALQWKSFGQLIAS